MMKDARPRIQDPYSTLAKEIAGLCSDCNGWQDNYLKIMEAVQLYERDSATDAFLGSLMDDTLERYRAFDDAAALTEALKADYRASYRACRADAWTAMIVARSVGDLIDFEKAALAIMGKEKE